MAKPVIITCALTGGRPTTPAMNPAVPVTPEAIARSAVEACNAGAAVVHIHARDLKTYRGTINVTLFEEVANRIRASGCDVILNLTTGDGGLVRPSNGKSVVPADFNDLLTPSERVVHIEALRPEICSVDIATMTIGDNVFINTPHDISAIARAAAQVGTLAELEVFELGHLQLAKALIARGEITPPYMFQLCLGVAGGAPATVETMAFMRNQLPPGAIWSAFGVGPTESSMVAAAVLLGGNVRVGLEDNLYLERGVLAASNAVLVERAAKIIRTLGSEVASPNEARAILNLRQTTAAASPN